MTKQALCYLFRTARQHLRRIVFRVMWRRRREGGAPNKHPYISNLHPCLLPRHALGKLWPEMTRVEKAAIVGGVVGGGVVGWRLVKGGLVVEGVVGGGVVGWRLVIRLEGWLEGWLDGGGVVDELIRGMDAWSAGWLMFEGHAPTNRRGGA